MGEVYRAWDPRLLRDVALKRLRSPGMTDAEARQRVLREARIPSCLRHPAIVKVFDIVEHEGEFYIVQEFVDGVTLRERMHRPFEIIEFARFAIPCAEALSEAAAKGILHRDLKPENIMMEEGDRPRILDFGLARRVALDELRTALPDDPTVSDLSFEPAGTPGYIAPEVLRGARPDARADLFAFGVICYEMITARHPFLKGTTPETFASILHDEPESLRRLNPEIPGSLEDLILEMLHKDPERRPGAETICARLGETLTGQGRQSPHHSSAEATAGAFRTLGGREAATRRPLLFVEPFIRQGGPEGLTLHVGAAMAEGIRSRLARYRGIDVLDSGHDAGATLVVSGIVEVHGSRIRVLHRILDRMVDQVIDSGGHEGEAGDPIVLRDRVCERIASFLTTHCRLTPGESASQRPSMDPGAYDYYLRAKAYLRQPQSEKDAIAAINLCEKALQIDPEFPLATATLGEAYSVRYAFTKDPQWVDRAVESAHRAFALAPSYPEVRTAMGDVYLTIGKPDLAHAAFQHALTSDIWSYSARLGLAKSLDGLAKAGEAEQAFREAIENQPDHWLGHNLLGVFYQNHARYREALRCFLRVVDLAPDYARGYSNLGAAYHCLGRIEEAIDSYRKSIEIGPNYAALSNLAALYAMQGNLERAAESIEAALKIDDRDYRVWGNLAEIYERLEGRAADRERATHRAIELAEQRREVSPGSPSLLAHLALLYEKVGQMFVAARLIDRALELDPDRVEVLLAAAQIHEAVGARDEAKASVLRALALGCSVETLRGTTLPGSLLEDESVSAAIRDLELRKEDSQ